MELNHEELTEVVNGLARAVVVQQVQIYALHSALMAAGIVPFVDDAAKERYRPLLESLEKGPLTGFLQGFERIFPKL